jgi:RHS repeat-associated protein
LRFALDLGLSPGLNNEGAIVFSTDLVDVTIRQESSLAYGIYFTNLASADFIASVTVAADSGDINHMLINAVNGPDAPTQQTRFNYSPALQEWTMETGGRFRKETRTCTGDPSGTRTETTVVMNTAGTNLLQTTEKYVKFAWGTELVERVVGTQDAPLTNLWQYSTTSGDGNYSQLVTWTGPGGHWEKYFYDAYGRLTSRVVQFTNNPSTSLAAENRETSIEYTNNVVITTESLRGQPVAHTYVIQNWDLTRGPGQELLETCTIRCAQPDGNIGGAGNLTNIVVRNTTTSEPVSSINPDGTASLYSGSLVTSFWRVEQTGQPDTTGSYIVEGSQTTTTVGDWGEVLYEETKEITAGRASFLTAQSQFTYSDLPPRSYSVTYLDQTTGAKIYNCCGLESETDADGVTTRYLLDPLRRPVATSRKWVVISNILDAAGNLVARYRQGGTEQPVRLWSANYDPAGRVLNETNALGGVTTHSYGVSAGLVHTVSYPDTRQRTEISNADGTLSSVTGSAAFPTFLKYGVDVNGTWTQEIKGAGDGSEWVKTYSDPLGRPYRTIFPDSASSESWFDDRGLLSKQRDPDGVTRFFLYNTKAEREHTVLGTSQNATPTLDATNRVIHALTDVVQLPGDALWPNSIVRRTRTWQRDEANQEVLVSEQWQGLDAVRSARMAFGLTNTSEFAYTPSIKQRIAVETAPDGSLTISLYSTGMLASVTRMAGATQLGRVAYGYDPQGRIHTVADVRNGTTTYGHNDADLVTTVTTPAPGEGSSAQTTTAHYDRSLRVTNLEYADHTSALIAYDGRGLAVQTWGSRTYPAGYSYDYAGRLKTMTNWSAFPSAGTRVTTWSYDSQRGWLTRKQYPLAAGDGQGIGPTYTHTPAGRLSSRVWARGIVTTNTFTAAGDLKTVAYLNDPSNAAGLSYSYDRRGRLQTLTQGAATETLAYSDAGQLLSESYIGGPLTGLSITNGFDRLLRRNAVAVTSEAATFTEFVYDDASRLKTITSGGGSATYGYLQNSPLVETMDLSYAGSTRLTTTKQYDLLNRLGAVENSAAGTAVSAHRYHYDDANLRRAITNADESRWAFDYDQLGQLTAGKKYWADGTPVAGQQFEYEFDQIGNRNWTKSGGNFLGTGLQLSWCTNNQLNQVTSRGVPGWVTLLGSATNTATITVNNQRAGRQGDYWWLEMPVNNATGSVWLPITNLAILNRGTNADFAVTNTGNLFLATNEQSFAHDVDGNLTNDGRWSYIWDTENRLIQMTAISAVAPTQQLRFIYDGQDRRISKTVSNFLTGTWQLESQQRFVYDGWLLVAILDATNGIDRSFNWGLDLSETPQGAGRVGGLLFMTIHRGANAGTYFYCYDGNGNVAALVNATTREVAARYEYGPFHELLRATGPVARLNPLLAATKFFDWESDLYYYGYRYYSSSTGRWLSRDPMGEIGSPNLYSLLANQPADSYDSLGLCGPIKSKEPDGTILYKDGDMWSPPNSPTRPSVTTSAAGRSALVFGSDFADTEPGSLRDQWLVSKNLDELRNVHDGAVFLLEQTPHNTFSVVVLGESFGGESVDAGGRVACAALSGPGVAYLGGKLYKVSGAVLKRLKGKSLADAERILMEASESTRRCCANAEKVPANSTVGRILGKLDQYPQIIDPRTGNHIPFPSDLGEIVPKAKRVFWGTKERGEFIAEWYRRGFEAPRGGWNNYDIHHIKPQEFGGGNDYWNFVPVERQTHRDVFYNFWQAFTEL